MGGIIARGGIGKDGMKVCNRKCGYAGEVAINSGSGGRERRADAREEGVASALKDLEVVETVLCTTKFSLNTIIPNQILSASQLHYAHSIVPRKPDKVTAGALFLAEPLQNNR